MSLVPGSGMTLNDTPKMQAWLWNWTWYEGWENHEEDGKNKLDGFEEIIS